MAQHKNITFTNKMGTYQEKLINCTHNDIHVINIQLSNLYNIIYNCCGEEIFINKKREIMN
jgi:hypothetical protein